MNLIKFQIASRILFKTYPDDHVNVQFISQMVLYNTRRRRGYNRRAGLQHLLAIDASGSRYEDLKQLNLPVLIVHGKADPLVPFAHGLKCAAIIPGARTLWIDGLGHGIPPQFAPLIHKHIFNLINRDTSVCK
jgi:pimeloyl-ACP methyl ester carboxylesterase